MGERRVVYLPGLDGYVREHHGFKIKVGDDKEFFCVDYSECFGKTKIMEIEEFFKKKFLGIEGDIYIGESFGGMIFLYFLLSGVISYFFIKAYMISVPLYLPQIKGSYSFNSKGVAGFYVRNHFYSTCFIRWMKKVEKFVQENINKVEKSNFVFIYHEDDSIIGKNCIKKAVCLLRKAGFCTFLYKKDNHSVKIFW